MELMLPQDITTYKDTFLRLTIEIEYPGISVSETKREYKMESSTTAFLEVGEALRKFHIQMLDIQSRRKSP